jgi:hypothetical protein
MAVSALMKPARSNMEAAASHKAFMQPPMWGPLGQLLLDQGELAALAVEEHPPLVRHTLAARVVEEQLLALVLEQPPALVLERLPALVAEQRLALVAEQPRVVRRPEVLLAEQRPLVARPVAGVAEQRPLLVRRPVAGVVEEHRLVARRAVVGVVEERPLLVRRPVVGTPHPLAAAKRSDRAARSIRISS